MDAMSTDTLTDVGVKSFDVAVKADQTGESREFTAVVSVFNNEDFGGDVVLPGAFAKSLDRFATAGKSIPIVWAHQYDDPESHIGEVLEAKELTAGDPLLPAAIANLGGLWVRGKLDEDARAKKVHQLMKGGRINEFSFSYNLRTTETEPVFRNGRELNGLKSIDLWELGPLLKGMNPATQLVSVKAADAPPPIAQSAPGGQDVRATLTMMKLYQASIGIKGNNHGSSGTHQRGGR